MNITVQIDSLGRAKTIEVGGTSGPTCTDLTKDLELALMSADGMKSTNLAPEFYDMTDGSQVEVIEGEHW